MKTRRQKQEELAKKRAVEVKETKSTYIAYAAVHGCEGVTPAIKVSVQNIINRAADALEQYDPEKAAKIRMEGDAIWDL